MRKLTLDPESLRVESFRTAAAPTVRGTVIAARAEIFPDEPVGYGSGCTDECMSNQSQCPILSCGSSCDPQEPGTGVGV